MKDACECCGLACGPRDCRDGNPLLGYLEKAFDAARRIGYFAADVRAIARDPALRSSPLALAEIILYASFWALAFHRVAHLLRALGIPFVPRLLSQAARLLTGIEIHPGATIGPGLFVDHGMGTVIGETAIVGANVLIYHGVTLGGVDSRPCRRHPLVEDGAIIGAGAKVLGPVTIGAGAKVGAQSVVLGNVPPNATAVGIPARIVRRTTEEARTREGSAMPG